ncbi:MAG: pseudouridine synthase [Gammaproteobacteria bacterium]
MTRATSRCRKRPSVKRLPASAAPGERLHKVLARRGLGSRRTIEAWIAAGRISVNGETARLGSVIRPGDAVRVDGQALDPTHLFAETRRVIAYYKPSGEVCTRSDPDGRRSVFEALPALATGRWVSVGRLDLTSSGLLLFTTDGALAHRLMHPASEVEREYLVRVLGTVSETVMKNLLAGVALEDGWARFDTVEARGGTGANQWFAVVLREGRNREVRRLWESQGLRVSRLMRIRYGPIVLARERRPGASWDLSQREVEQLLASVEGDRRHPAQHPLRAGRQPI